MVAPSAERIAMGRDADPKKWDYPAHTGAKHDILSHYLNGWFAKLGSRWDRILFFDGFAGRGRYNDGSEGSPIIALRLIAGHAIAANRHSTTFDFLFVEKDADNASALRTQITDLSAELDGFPSNVRYRIENGRFEDHATALVDQAGRKSPTFAFIDPYGFSGIPMDVVARFVNFPATEVFVNLMVDWVARFGEKELPESMSSLYGLPVEEVMREFDDEDLRHEYLRDRYMEQLRLRAGFTYVQSFAMRGANGKVLYYLIHGTRHPAGVTLMKEAMWKVDPTGGSMFRDREARSSEALFDIEELGPNLAPLEDLLLNAYAGREDVPVTELKSSVGLGPSQFREVHATAVLETLSRAKRIRLDKRGRAHDAWRASFP
jgi:three-Cys-motif partner protein